MPKPTAITIPIGTSLRDIEKIAIEATLRHLDGNVVGAARVLGIDRGTLYEKIRQYKSHGGLIRR